MRRLIMPMTAGTMLAACAAAPGELSCADLARTRAAAQMGREIAMLEQHERGLAEKSDVQRKFIAMDAEAYRLAVYEQCLRRQDPAGEEN